MSATFGKGSRQKKKKCVKATAYPCGFTCIARRLPNGKEKICHNVLRNQAKTATLWLAKVEEKLGKINERRNKLGHSTLYVNEKARLTPAKSSINPSGLTDKELLNAFEAEKGNRKSSVLLAALGKEIGRRKRQSEYQQKAEQARAIARKAKDKTTKSKANQVASKFEKMASALAVRHTPDRNGDLLRDKNFNKADFEDFDIPAKAFKSEVEAKKAHRELAKKYHPDRGGSAEQMANLNVLFDQILAKIRKDREKKGRSPSKSKPKETTPKKTVKDTLKDINEQLGKQADQELDCLFG